MTRDEIREIADIVGGDRSYVHFVHRINKEFEASDDDRNSRVFVLYQIQDDEKIGFCVIGDSPVKMRVWEKTFKDEGWVSDTFAMGDPCYELMYMYIQPEFRSKGMGKELFGRALRYAKKNDVNAIYAYVSDRTNTALEFYKKMNASVLQDFSDEDITSAFLEWKL